MNTMKNSRAVEPYLIFGGRCEEAIEYYRKTLGATVDRVLRFKDAPESTGAPDDWVNKVMHASFRIGENTVMASDGCWQEKCTGFQGFSLSLSVPNEAEADRRFHGLADGGEIIMPMDKTFFAKRFGMVKDRFGVRWMVIVPAEMPVGAGKLEAAVA